MNKLFTHTDLDGIGCAVLAKIVFGDNVDISYCNYDDIDKKVNVFFNNTSNMEYHITDISINEELAAKIDHAKDNCVLLDHHPTAFALNKYDWCHVIALDVETGLKTCGTELYYKWLVENSYLSTTEALDTFVEAVRDYDTWRWVELGEAGMFAKQLNDLLYIYGRDGFIDWCIDRINSGMTHEVDGFAQTLLNYRQKDIDSYIEEKNKQMRVKKITIDSALWTCGVVFAERFFSELGNRLSEMHPELDFIVMIGMDGKISYRTTKKHIDLGKDIAKVFGGGGHPQAAGSYFKTDLVSKLVDDILTVPKKEEKERHTHQKWVDYVKISADSIKDNAESIVGSEKYLKDMTVSIRLYPDELPEINVDRNFHPEKLFKM